MVAHETMSGLPVMLQHTELAVMKVGKRQALHADYRWLYELKSASMRTYIDAVYGWDEAVQEKYFKRTFHPEQITIVTVNGADAGMFVLDRDETGYFLKRIEVHPSFQGRGVGTAVIQEIIDKASFERENVRLMVFKINPAQGLYKRLGFKIVDETETHYEMKISLE